MTQKVLEKFGSQSLYRFLFLTRYTYITIYSNVFFDNLSRYESNLKFIFILNTKKFKNSNLRKSGDIIQ